MDLDEPEWDNHGQDVRGLQRPAGYSAGRFGYRVLSNFTLEIQTRGLPIMVEKPHPAFRQPENGNIWVWRYMDLPKFVWMLEHQELYFARADMLGDAHEGSITYLNKLIQVNKGRNIKNIKFDETLRKAREIARLLIYVNCWHANEYESEAMWKLYCSGEFGVAVKTTYERLAEFAHSRGAFIGLVKYRDYKYDTIPSSDMYSPFMSKRKAFAHEREVRLLLDRFELATQKDEDGQSHISETQARQTPIGQVLDGWNVADMVYSVCIHPFAPKWYKDVVTKLVRIW